MRIKLGALASVVVLAVALLSPDCELALPSNSSCGPDSAFVRRVIDGDTIELSSGERLRYLLVDTPEIHPTQDCFGQEAKKYNEALVAGKTISLTYDAECRDKYGRLLAYVRADGTDVNASLIDAGMACVLVVPPNGQFRSAEFKVRQTNAELHKQGLWGSCEKSPCRRR